MRNFRGPIRGGVLNFHGEQKYFHDGGAYFYAEQPYFYAAGACFYAEQPYFYGTCASFHGKRHISTQKLDIYAEHACFRVEGAALMGHRKKK